MSGGGGKSGQDSERVAAASAAVAVAEAVTVGNYDRVVKERRAGGQGECGGRGCVPSGSVTVWPLEGKPAGSRFNGCPCRNECVAVAAEMAAEGGDAAGFESSVAKGRADAGAVRAQALAPRRRERPPAAAVEQRKAITEVFVF